MIIQVILHESSAQRTKLSANYKHKSRTGLLKDFEICDLAM
jgi:hypothetical protein